MTPDTAVLKARPTTYNGIEMRSRLEARVAAFLDSCDVTWQYEPRAFASGTVQYLPDFLLDGIADSFGAPRRWYLEVKGGDRIDWDLMDRVEKRMKVILANEPLAGLLVGVEYALEKSLFLLVNGTIVRLLQLMECPDHRGNLFFASNFGAGPDEAWVGRCVEAFCKGIAWRPQEERRDMRRAMAPWVAA